MKINMTSFNKTRHFHNSTVKIPDGYLINSSINRVKCKLDGYILPNLDAKIEISGKLYMDSVYPFEVNIQENFKKYLKNGEKTLDINLIIWENIVLEVPMIINDNLGNVYQE